MNNYRVTASVLELRAGPGTEYPVLRRLAHDTELVEKAAANAQGWVEVETSTGGHSGWVASRYLSPDAGNPDQANTAPASALCSSDAPGLVFDLSHFNGKVDLAAAFAAGQRGVIHKATDGSANSPHSISGVGDCDRNRFNGDEQQLQAFWNKRGT